jgi:hypothetical protein
MIFTAVIGVDPLTRRTGYQCRCRTGTRGSGHGATPLEALSPALDLACGLIPKIC